MEGRPPSSGGEPERDPDRLVKARRSAAGRHPSRTALLAAAFLAALVALVVTIAVTAAQDRAVVRDDPLAGLDRSIRSPDPDPGSVVIEGASGALPVPEALPTDPYAATPQQVVGRIQIPSLGIDEQLQRGITLTAIDRGPGWWPGTAMPGELGNVVVAGHRTTHSKPFADLHLLQPGELVIFTTDAGTSTYEVRGVIVVPGDWIDIAAQSEAHTATLFACHPPGSAAERIVAKLRMVGPDGAPVDPETALPALDAEAQRTEHTLVMRPPEG